jgi:hypothetical protein
MRLEYANNVARTPRAGDGEHELQPSRSTMRNPLSRLVDNFAFRLCEVDA